MQAGGIGTLQAFQMMKGAFRSAAVQLWPHRTHATSLGIEDGTAQLTQATIAVDRSRHPRPTRLGWQQAATQSTVDRHAQLELAGHEVDAAFLAGEQVELLVGLDQLIGIQGPGRARHLEHSKRGAQH
ncbi:hypothetical protein METHP14_210060 [Pseudomonas sp. P14-2025]